MGHAELVNVLPVSSFFFFIFAITVHAAVIV